MQTVLNFCVWILIGKYNLVKAFHHIQSLGGNIHINIHRNTQSWLGILKIKSENSDTINAMTGIVLIVPNWAVGNANDLSVINKTDISIRTVATFFNKDTTVSDYDVANVYIHPEFRRKTLNTLGLLKLKSLDKNYQGQPILWPKTPFILVKQVFYAGFTDHKRILEQVMYEMIPVEETLCNEFYSSDGLNLQMYWPVFYRCFQSKSNDTCIYDAGMAIVAKKPQGWELIGISTYGAGCSLPSRFIQFFPYLPWIRRTIQASLTTFTRRFQWHEGPHEKDLDDILFSYLYDKKVEYTQGYDREEIILTGTSTDCKDDAALVYHEIEELTGKFAGIFAVTLWDATTINYTCIVSTISCSARTNVKVMIRKGFGKSGLESIVKRIPHYRIKYLKAKKQTTIIEIPVVTDNYVKYRENDTITMWFKFEVSDKALIDIVLYAKKSEIGYSGK